ncbi:MAG: hypothetical protein ACFFA5_09385 [Promethearchaeota archaeon]
MEKQGERRLKLAKPWQLSPFHCMDIDLTASSFRIGCIRGWRSTYTGAGWTSDTDTAQYFEKYSIF